jgi:hypothetical protein
VRIPSSSLCTITMVLVLAACAAPPARDPTVQPLAPDSPGQTTASTEHTTDTQDEIVCRAERATGTRFKKERCRRRSDMDQQTRQAQDAMREAERGSANRSDMPPG